ncbi:MAG: propionate CoA-transferase [Oscillospiraceae bacterium]|jgi:propionate CoA-transferase|nr:propionate CoA-transferase [Oscillospiraceae bacterium]
MFKIVSAREAIDKIPDGARIAINSFLALSNPEELHKAIHERFTETGLPGNLRLFCAAGFGAWDESRYADPYIAAGAVSEIIAGHYNSMPGAVKAALAEKIEAYCLPLGLLSQAIRAAASGKDWFLSEVGVGIYADPRVGTCALNSISKQKIAEVRELEGKEYLLFHIPKIDVALIKGTTVDPNGNITFEKEYLTVDALALAQATKRSGGRVIVQVERVSHKFSRPRNVIVPGILVDDVVVVEAGSRSPQNSFADSADYNPALSGDVHVPASQMDYYVNKLSTTKFKKVQKDDNTADIIGERAARELHPGHIVNIGIGIPETVGKYASKLGILKDIVTTVEAGGIGGLPAPGVAFGATIGADMVCDMAAQFDFYDGGGLDICFLGGLEADMHGNVNVHKLEGGYPGIGGFANITFATKIIVFCMSFTTKGLVACRDAANGVRIKQEGSIAKFKSEIAAVSFSGANAIKRGQRVLYVTERCVFELTENGLKLKEVYNGIDERKQIRELLDFEV